MRENLVQPLSGREAEFLFKRPKPQKIKKKESELSFFSGGARRDRTADLLHAMQALSQLSYSPSTRRCYDKHYRLSIEFFRKRKGLN